MRFKEISQVIRALRQAKGFTMVAVSILAVGIAASTVVFSILSAVILRPLPYSQPERLMVVNWHGHEGLLSQDVSAAAFFMLRERSRSFENIAAMSSLHTGVNLSEGGTPQYVRACRVSTDFFRVLDVRPMMGRNFSAEEEQPGGPRAAVLSYALWEQQFNKDPLALGRQINIDQDSFTVVGVMPSGFRSYPEADLWLPLPISPATADPGNEYRVIARLREGVTQQAAQSELDSPEYARTYPLLSWRTDVRLVLNPLQASVAARVRTGLELLFGAVLFVLLITCTNLALLLTVRSAGRMREVAIRLALGSSRGQLIRMFLLESLLIGVIGGVLGVILAKEAIPFVLLVAPKNLPLADSIRIDGQVLSFAALASLFTAFAFGLAPALTMSRPTVAKMLRQATTNVTGSAEHVRLGRLLVSGQAALAILLLTGSGLLLRSFSWLQSVPPGFDAKHLWAAQIWLAANRYKSTSASAQFVDDLREKIKRDGNIEAAATVTGLPLEPGLNLVLQQADAPDKTVYGEYRIVSPEYFQAMRIPMNAGREFQASDARQTTPVAIVNQTLANRWWPGQPALDRYVIAKISRNGAFSGIPLRIIGIAADVHESGLSTPTSPTVFVPIYQIPDNITEFANRTFLLSLVVRTTHDSSPAGSIRAAVTSTDPALPVASVRPISEVVAAYLSRHQFYTSLITAFGILALILTGVGLYGLLSWQIVLRTREIGVRMALGAPRAEVVFMVVKQGLGLVLAGALAGILAAPLEKRALATMLYNVRGAMSVVLISALAVLAGVAVLASLCSAFRAASVDPSVTLSAE